MEQPTKISRRELLRLAGILGAGLALAGCGSQPPAAAPTAAPAESNAGGQAPASGEKIPLHLVVMDYDQNMKRDTQALIDAFNSSQGDIEAKLDVYGWGEGHDLLVTQISGGQAPDLANGSAQWLGEWASIKELAPLDDLLPQEFLANFVPSGLNAFKLSNQLMVCPISLTPGPCIIARIYLRKRA